MRTHERGVILGGVFIRPLADCTRAIQIHVSYTAVNARVVVTSGSVTKAAPIVPESDRRVGVESSHWGMG